MPVKVKICGITNRDDALAAVEFGADALGFVFFQGSPRYLSLKNAAAIIKKLPSMITTIAVFVNEKPEKIENIIHTTGVDVIQLHGDEPPLLLPEPPHRIRVNIIARLSDYISRLIIAFAFKFYITGFKGHATIGLFTCPYIVIGKYCV